MAELEEDNKHSTDSGVGFVDSDLENSVADVFSPVSLVAGLKQATSSSSNTSYVKNADHETAATTSASKTVTNISESEGLSHGNSTAVNTIPKMPSFSFTSTEPENSDKTFSSSHLTKSRSADDYNSKSSLLLNDPFATGRPRSTSDVRHSRSDVRVFHLIYHGSLTLDRKITQPMVPWIIAEKRRNNKEKMSILLQVSERGLLGISEAKGSVLFEHRLHNVFKFTPGFNALFAYQWKLDEETPSSKLFILESEKKEDIGRIQLTIKNATRNALQLDLGRSHSIHEVGRAALEDLKDNNCTMFEVLYCGRVTVSHKSAPPSLIDDAIERFKAHEQEVQKKSLEMSKRHFSCEDKLDCIPTESKDSQTAQSSSLDALDSSGYQSSGSGSVSSVLTGDSDKDWELLPQERERTGSGASVNSRSSVNSDGPRSTKPTLKRQDTFVKLVTSRETSHNRTMVFQIGKSALTLISTDRKSFALTKKFTEISYCSQGIKNPEYFGFICREADGNAAIFKCYVFKVQDEATVDVVMATLRQAFSAAMEDSKCNAICETCPMQIYHKLCVEVKDMTPEKALNVMRKLVETLEEKQKSALAAFLRLEKPDDQQSQNELIMTFLRSLFEQKQALHSHTSKETPQDGGGNQSMQKQQTTLKVDTNVPEGAFKKAKKSLASSFENLLSRNKNKNSPEVRRKKPLVSFRSQPSLQTLQVTTSDAETSPMDEKLSPPKHTISTPHVSTSPLSVGSTPERGQQHLPPLAASPISPPTSLSLTVNLTTENGAATQNGRTASERNNSEEPEALGPAVPQRRRSKTLGDCPSPLSPTTPPATAYAVPLSPISFTTPTTRDPVKKQKSKPRPLLRTMSVDMGSGSPFPVTPSMTDKRRTSFRQAIFKRVVTPMSEKKFIPDISEEADVFEESEDRSSPERGHDENNDTMTGQFKNKAWVRALWKRAIKEQILLNRMEKENIKLQDRQNAVSESKMKMGYEEIMPCTKEVIQSWHDILVKADDHYYLKEIINLLKQGIPRLRAGEIWVFLRSHMERRSASILQPCPKYEPYSDLIKQLTTHQHAILIDLGRTYPNHPYFSHPLGRGQLSLFNILKGYSLLDWEVGYCQGLSFVAGFLLMHMEEQQAFDMLVFIMYGLGCRRQYKPDMVALQIQMYQLSRLLHDFHRELHDHLEANEVGPSFYAAPWFLTFFTSQFPLGFVARVFDMLFAQGMEAVFKVALNILGSHSKKLLACENFEELIEYIKDQLPKMQHVELEKIITQSYNLDISKELQAFEVEYHVIQEEMLQSPVLVRSGSTEQQLESANQNLRRHNEELLEQLQTARNTINSQEKTIHDLQEKEVQQKKQLEKLHSERSTFSATLNKLLELIPQDALKDSGIDIEAIKMLAKLKSNQRRNGAPSVVLFPSTENGLHENENRDS